MSRYSRNASAAILAAVSLTAMVPAYAERVVELTTARLQLAQQVAASKWLHKAAIDDPQREAALLEEMREQARVVGVSGDWIAQFFRDQIEASKAAQRGWFALWSSGSAPVPDQAPDLRTLVRPQIDALDQQLLATLAAKGGVASAENCADKLADAVQALAVSPPLTREIVTQALAHACQPPSPD